MAKQAIKFTERSEWQYGIVGMTIDGEAKHEFIVGHRGGHHGYTVSSNDYPAGGKAECKVECRNLAKVRRVVAVARSFESVFAGLATVSANSAPKAQGRGIKADRIAEVAGWIVEYMRSDATGASIARFDVRKYANGDTKAIKYTVSKGVGKDWADRPVTRTELVRAFEKLEADDVIENMGRRSGDWYELVTDERRAERAMQADQRAQDKALQAQFALLLGVDAEDTHEFERGTASNRGINLNREQAKRILAMIADGAPKRAPRNEAPTVERCGAYAVYVTFSCGSRFSFSKLAESVAMRLDTFTAPDGTQYTAKCNKTARRMVPGLQARAYAEARKALRGAGSGRQS